MEKEFFSELQKHSQAKLQILNNYVIPWMRKIVLGTKMFGGKCLVIDGFAGKGKYNESNSDGSPLILLKNAIDFCEQAKENKWDAPNIMLIFIEGNSSNYQELINNIELTAGVKPVSDIKGKFFFSAVNYPSIKIACVNDEFKNVLSFLLDAIPSLIPSFCFIDPFGFSQTPFTLIKRFMKNGSAEILLNFIYEETNRFINHPNKKIQEQISSHFGVENLEELKQLLSETKNPLEKKQAIVDYYSSQLHNQASAEYVVSFEIKKGGKTKLILFFATKNHIGLNTMKQAMWKLDGTGTYLFDDRKETNQIEFDFVSEDLLSQHIEKLSKEIQSEFSNKKNITKEEIELFVITKTNFPTGKIVTGALRVLEEKKIIRVTKMDPTKKRKKGTFSKVFIEFDF